MYYVYILASKRYGTLYIGVTNDLRKRMEQHRLGVGSEFVKAYKVYRLVYVEPYENAEECHPPGEAAQEMESRLENTTHRTRQSRLAGFDALDQLTCCPGEAQRGPEGCGVWVPAFAGTTRL